MKKVKSSITHHSLEVYVSPAMTSSSLHPERKIGRHGSDAAMLLWSMHACRVAMHLSCAWVSFRLYLIQTLDCTF